MTRDASDRIHYWSYITILAGLVCMMFFLVLDPTGCIQKHADQNAKMEKQNYERWLEREVEKSLSCRWSRRYGVCICHLHNQVTPNNIPQDLCK